jgi:signal peptidase I
VFAKTDIKRGDYIMFRFATKYINDGKPIKAIKEVVCTPGDELKVNGKDYYCRGAYIGTAKDTAMTGDKVDNFKFNGAVPEQSYFVVGHIKDSYDSKYYGFIKRDNIEKIALPIY